MAKFGLQSCFLLDAFKMQPDVELVVSWGWDTHVQLCMWRPEAASATAFVPQLHSWWFLKTAAEV